ncbi:MAG: type II secretion system minor pseudopilin GspH [Roseibium album]|uniref:type II secretion system minor pseudopilin GspH n=1 Tax=Roseibium album TaxID=311410 RepID=UPI0032EB6F0C
MPTSASRISDTPREVFQRGFTLLELLVVVVLVALLTGTVILGFTGADTEQRLRGGAEQLAYTIELGRQYALQRNREWGLYVEPDAIEFAEFDPEERAWVTQVGRPFDKADLMPGVTLRVESEGLGDLPSAERDRLPKVILFSSGEVTPFTLFMEPEWNAPAWEVSSDGLSRTAAARAEF